MRDAASFLTDELNSHGIETTIGHNLTNARNADLIIYSAAIKDNDPEMEIAKEIHSNKKVADIIGDRLSRKRHFPPC